MSICKRCGKQVTGIGSLLTFDRRTGRCSTCEGDVRTRLVHFRRAFLEACRDGILPAERLTELVRSITAGRIDLAEALEYVRGDALNLLERNLAFASEDGIITDEEEADFNRLRHSLAIPDEMAKPLIDRLNYLKKITAIRRGNLPSVQPSKGMHLESDEVCHMDVPARYHKVNAKSVTVVDGRLFATNKKLRFLSPMGGVEIPWKNIMRIQREAGAVYLELSSKRGNGRYDVHDPLMAEATIEAIVKIHKRQIVGTDEDSESRRIPHDVKVAVWQRDQGKCVQCGATSYLEFDHIIPFAKGGANTIQNVQLLCRRCNLAKSDRI